MSITLPDVLLGITFVIVIFCIIIVLIKHFPNKTNDKLKKDL